MSTTKVDPKNWVGSEEFTAWDAACLLFGLEPLRRASDAPAHILAMRDRIEKELKPSYTVPHSHWEYYSRRDLEEFSAKLGLPFLREVESEKEADEIREDLKQNLLVLFGILAEMYVEKSGPGLRRGDKINKKALREAIANYAGGHGITASILGATQFNDRLNEALSLLRTVPVSQNRK